MESFITYQVSVGFGFSFYFLLQQGRQGVIGKTWSFSNHRRVLDLHGKPYLREGLIPSNSVDERSFLGAIRAVYSGLI